MTLHMHLSYRRLAVGAALATLLQLAGITTSAQTGCEPEDFAAWAVNTGPSAGFLSAAVDIHVARWSTERDKGRFARTLLNRGPEALLKALRLADSVGTIRTPM